MLRFVQKLNVWMLYLGLLEAKSALDIIANVSMGT